MCVRLENLGEHMTFSEGLPTMNKSCHMVFSFMMFVLLLKVGVGSL